jgi:hypothetical protein
MPRGPKGEKRPADVIGNAVHVMRIATGEIEDRGRDPAKELHRKGGLKGGVARANSLSSDECRENHAAHGRDLRRLVQLASHPQDASRYARDGGWPLAKSSWIGRTSPKEMDTDDADTLRARRAAMLDVPYSN